MKHYKTRFYPTEWALKELRHSEGFPHGSVGKELRHSGGC